MAGVASACLALWPALPAAVALPAFSSAAFTQPVLPTTRAYPPQRRVHRRQLHRRPAWQDGAAVPAGRRRRPPVAQRALQAAPHLCHRRPAAAPGWQPHRGTRRPRLGACSGRPRCGRQPATEPPATRQQTRTGAQPRSGAQHGPSSCTGPGARRRHAAAPAPLQPAARLCVGGTADGRRRRAAAQSPPRGVSRRLCRESGRYRRATQGTAACGSRGGTATVHQGCGEGTSACFAAAPQQHSTAQHTTLPPPPCLASAGTIGSCRWGRP